VAHRTPDRCESIDHATSAASVTAVPGSRQMEAASGGAGFSRGHTKKFVIEFLSNRSCSDPPEPGTANPNDEHEPST
jgi:hypothetical protein